MINLQPKKRMIYPEKSIVYCNSNRFPLVSSHFAACPAPHSDALLRRPNRNRPELVRPSKPCVGRSRPNSHFSLPALGLFASSPSVPLPGPMVSRSPRLSSCSSVEFNTGSFSAFPLLRRSTFPVRPRLTLRVRRFYVLRPCFSFALLVCFFSVVRPLLFLNLASFPLFGFIQA
jgi:hypothetical protein